MEVVFGVSAAEIQTTMVTYLLGFALAQALYGPITDRFGRKPPLYFSLMLFVVSSAACAFAPTIPIMAGLRLLQAIGACGGSVISRAVVRDVFPPSELRRVFSMLILVLGVSPILAPMLGSYLLLWFGWRAAFVTQAIVGLTILTGIHFRLSESLHEDSRRSLDLRSITSAYSTLLKDTTFVGASVVCGFSSAGAFAYITSAPFVFVTLYQVPVEQFGWLFGSIAAGMVAGSQINGRLPHSVAIWRVLRYANLAQLAVAFVLLAGVLTGAGGLPLVYACVFIYVTAQGFVFPNGSAIAMMRHGEIAGSASALLGTNQFLIAGITTLFLGTVDNPAIPMAMVIAGCSVASNVLNFLTLGPRLEVTHQTAAAASK